MDPPLAVLEKPKKMTMKFKCYALKKKKKKKTQGTLTTLNLLKPFVQF